jgi:hypothetical protein
LSAKAVVRVTLRSTRTSPSDRQGRHPADAGVGGAGERQHGEGQGRAIARV